jgi:hypothetical protein
MPEASLAIIAKQRLWGFNAGDNVGMNSATTFLDSDGKAAKGHKKRNTITKTII